MSKNKPLDEVLKIAKGIEPISFYEVDSKLKNSIQNATKKLYSIIKKTLPDDSGPLSELITQGLTSEQIWEEINLANNPMIKLLNKNIKTNLREIEEIDFPTVLSKEEEERMLEEEEDDDEEEDNEGALLNEEDFDENGEMEKLNDDEEEGEDGDEYDHLRRRKYREDDSDFFNVEKMEEFVQQAEKQNQDDQELQEMLYGKSVGDDVQNEFASYKYDDFFGDNREREEDDEFHGMKESLAGFNGKMPYHLLSKDEKDFDPEDLDDDEEEEEEEQKKESKKKTEAKEKKKKKEKKQDDKEESDELEKLDPNYSKQKALKEQIKLLEEENLSKKEWALSGEVSSKARPLDSLIEKNVEFDVATRPVPIITEDFTDRIEKMIKKRILQEAWDDVVRKEIVNIPYKPKIELNKEKSDKGLSEIYEQQYKDKMEEAAGKPNSIIDEIQSSGNEKLDKFKIEIHNDWEKLQYKLDIMSNMSFAPKPPTLNIIKKEKNSKTVTVLDEATPQTINASELIAPQEVLSVENKPLKGESELTKEDRKRKRKLNKEKYKERLEENIKKYGKSKKQVEKEVLAQRNVTKAKREDNTQYTKSSQFFQKLQQDSQKPKKKKKVEKKGNASKYLF